MDNIDSFLRAVRRADGSDGLLSGLAADYFGVLPISPAGVADFDNLLHCRQITEQIFPASLAKIMTALVALEYLKLDHQVMIIDDDLVIGSGYNLKTGDIISVENLIINMMLPSSNIAAKAVARAVTEVSGLGFVSLMNDKARQLGMTATVFKNPTGLSDRQQLSTVVDLMRLGVAAVKHRDLARLWGLSVATLTITGANARSIRVASSFAAIKDMPWCLGGKSGSFSHWGYHLLCHVRLKFGYTGIAVVLKSPSSEQRDLDMIGIVNNLSQQYHYPCVDG
ncbi:D-alanyl-D-alanine carboxypeptidase family protein [Moraxella cuniculi]|uniref:D-alanyl-D-alanine carboxypeptidase dacB n=1 Tax=Moraxella cuniculi TaxID=34061 RepID=A0A3S4SC01_9GAMM|nr:serine hydrolase [Moraxella cuniculi]VEG12711.1 D-alanyl-D-alanine carboxypeptidase dacB precursor [Moraxella cuniculi]